jgi:hypothetical protein
MDDLFLEKIVPRRKTGKDYLMLFGIVIGGLILLVLIFMFGGYVSFLFPFLVVGLGYGVWYLMTSMNREYEYIVTNGDLDIDMIISRRKRKRIFSAKAKDFELMAQIDSDEYRNAVKGTYKLLDCSATINAPGNWFILTDYKGQRHMVIFNPDERMLKSLKRFNPSKIKYVIYGA